MIGQKFRAAIWISGKKEGYVRVGVRHEADKRRKYHLVD